jgi:signal transduction histidine kinase
MRQSRSTTPISSNRSTGSGRPRSNAERRVTLLAEASSLFGESLDCAVVLSRLAEIMVRTFADWCVIDVLEGDEIRRAAQAHRDPAKQPILDALKDRSTLRWGSRHPVSRVLANGRPILAPEISEAFVRELATDEEHLRLALTLGDRTGMVVPLIARGRVLGAITLASAQPAGRFVKADLEVCQEVAGRAAMAVDNAQLCRQAEEALRLRDEFLTVASHELNTPIAALMIGARGLSECGPEEVPRLAALIERQTARLARLVKGLLEATRKGQEPLTLELEDVDLAALVREVVSRLDFDLKRACCEVSLVSADGPIMGRWDRVRMEQVVLNLLSNAAKFGTGRPIELRIETDGDRARLLVTDHGIGIDPACTKRLFERFGRGVSAEHYGGLGLGLYMCRQILRAHGGSISVDSRLGHGATFTVELPRAGAEEESIP